MKVNETAPGDGDIINTTEESVDGKFFKNIIHCKYDLT